MSDDQLLSSEKVIAEAIARAGLDNFGDTFFMEPMERMLESLRTEANLSEGGTYGQYERTVALLVNRLRTEQAFSDHPEIAAEVINAPVVIVGLPRTGTTMLSRILSSDPRLYTLYWWEARNPAPFPPQDAEGEDDIDPRIPFAEEMIAQMLAAVPELASIHPFDAHAHDEEILLLEHSFMSTVPEASAWVPSYQHWLEQQPQHPAYADLKRMLQFLQWQKKRRGDPGQRWVLKTPHHLHFMPVLLDTFPDALILQTHRDPLETLPSMASLWQSLYLLASTEVDTTALGASLLDKWADSMQRCLDFRRANPELNVMDIAYRDSVRSPMAVVERIYGRMGLEFSNQTEQDIRDWLDENRREQREEHRYSMETFGLDRATLKSRFQHYRQHYL